MEGQDDCGKKVMEIMNKWVRIEIKDGRVIIGRLACVDAQCNVILSDSIEYRAIEISPGHIEKCKRSIGMTLILSQHLVKCQVAAPDDVDQVPT